MAHRIETGRRASQTDAYPSRTEFLETVRIEHGPPDVLGRFFLLADSVLKELGLKLYVSSLVELADIQSSHSATWPLFAPMLDPRLGGVDPDLSYGFIGVDRLGRIACSQGGRIYRSPLQSLAELIDDQSFFYGHGRRGNLGQPRCSCTAPSASHVLGTFTYSGALWVHPEHRGHRLAALLPRLSRAYALTRWNSAYTIAVVSEQIAASPLMAMYAYKTVEREFRIANIGPKDYVGHLMILTANELIADLQDLLSEHSAQIDTAVGDRRTENDRLVAGQR